MSFQKKKKKTSHQKINKKLTLSWEVAGEV
jgi:hypothetical protein